MTDTPICYPAGPSVSAEQQDLRERIAKYLYDETDEEYPRVSELSSAILELIKGAVKPLDEWAEEDGDVLWWCWDGSDWLSEAPYVGSPMDLGQTVECHTHRETGERPAARFQVGGWPGYHTHWTRLPAFPPAPASSQQ